MQVVDSLLTSWHINEAWHFDSFKGFLVEGQQRVGKSSFCSQAGAEAFGEWDLDPDKMEAKCVEPNYELVKPWVVFLPKEFLDLVLKVGIGKKYRLLIWDDAGFWLFILDWYEAFVKTVAKYIQLAGRQFSCIMLTTPSQKMISSKVLEALPELYVVKVIRRGKDTGNRRPRRAKIYQRWNYPDGRKGGVRKRWADDFDALLPNKYWSWYRPKSDQYMQAGLDLLQKEVNKLEKDITQKREEAYMEKVYKVAGDEDRLREVKEVIEALQSEKQ